MDAPLLGVVDEDDLVLYGKAVLKRETIRKEGAYVVVAGEVTVVDEPEAVAEPVGRVPVRVTPWSIR